MGLYAAEYKSKLISPEGAAALVKSGDWVDYGMIANIPELFDAALAKRVNELEDVKVRGGLASKPLQILEGLGIGKNLHKIVAAASGIGGDRHIVIPRRPGNHLVQRSITTAGVDPIRPAGLGRFPGDPTAVAGCPGHLDPIIQILQTADFLNGLSVFGGSVPASRRGIDDEKMGHFLLSFRVSEVNI